MKKRQLLWATLVLLLIWEIAALLLDEPILPTPVQVAQVFVQELLYGQLLGHFLISFWRVIASIFLAILAAVPLGLNFRPIEAAQFAFSSIYIHPLPDPEDCIGANHPAPVWDWGSG